MGDGASLPVFPVRDGRHQFEHRPISMGTLSPVGPRLVAGARAEGHVVKLVDAVSSIGLPRISLDPPSAALAQVAKPRLACPTPRTQRLEVLAREGL